jgi:hypothetical protein
LKSESLKRSYILRIDDNRVEFEGDKELDDIVRNMIRTRKYKFPEEMYNGRCVRIVSAIIRCCL